MCAMHVVYGVSVVRLSTEVTVVDVKRERENQSTEKLPIQIWDSNTRSSTYNSFFWVLRYWVHSRGAEHQLEDSGII